MGKFDLARALLETGSFHWKAAPQFTLASGRASEYYVNCKQLLAHPQYRRILAELIAQHLKGWDVQAVGGMEIGAIPISTAVSDYVYDRTGRELRTFVVRKKAKDHGMKHAVEGAFQAGDRVLVVDDVLTTGQATIDAITQARAAGLDVQQALVIVDRQEDNGRQRVEALGVPLTSLLTLQDLKDLKGKP
ncbi:MAG: orotate phosphoribosyltransferase, partial [Nitrospirae bacterium RIFCSPLOWO2_12_FULL_63_8]